MKVDTSVAAYTPDAVSKIPPLTGKGAKHSGQYLRQTPGWLAPLCGLRRELYNVLQNTLGFVSKLKSSHRKCVCSSSRSDPGSNLNCNDSLITSSEDMVHNTVVGIAQGAREQGWT